jgi:hypothetical protein
MRRSAAVNAGLVIAALAVSLFLAKRAENFEDLVFAIMMMYSAGFLFFGNLVVAAVQAWRRQEWIPHAIAAVAVALAMAVLFSVIRLI